jgi:hypothetical protein
MKPSNQPHDSEGTLRQTADRFPPLDGPVPPSPVVLTAIGVLVGSAVVTLVIVVSLWRHAPEESQWIIGGTAAALLIAGGWLVSRAQSRRRLVSCWYLAALEELRRFETLSPDDQKSESQHVQTQLLRAEVALRDTGAYDEARRLAEKRLTSALFESKTADELS